ncbi:MAG: carboxyl-terminal processing protease [Sphingobacteriales bacterium]|jgi:carboxyl-terminal processing protease
MKRKNIVILSLGAILSMGILFGFKNSNNLFEVSKNLEIFNSVFRELNMYYVDEPEAGKLIKVGIDAILKELDPYTTYIPESDIEDYRFMTTGKYGGIGAMIRKVDSIIFISEPYSDSPALKNGLRAGDQLIKVEGKEVAGKTISEVSDLLKGKAGSEVKIEFKRGSTSQVIQFPREEIKVPDVPFYKMLDTKTGYIKLNRFTQTASSEVKSAFLDLKEQGMENLVFDLRGNGGGLLMEAVKIVNFFIPTEKEVVSVRGRVKEFDQIHITKSQPLDTLIPIGVLVNGGTASASEIVSGALQDYDRAVIIGDNTFGKGLVQNTKDLSYNSKIKLTTAKYYIPSGRCIQRIQYNNSSNSSNAAALPDSLLKSFVTMGGRKVIDGRGIAPDVEVKDSIPVDLLSALYGNSYFFKFINNYTQKIKDPASVQDIEFGEAQFSEFFQFLKDEKFDYKSDPEKALADFKKSLEKGDWGSKASTLALELEKELTEDEWELIQKHKDLLQEILKNELASRYFYQTGRFEASIANDTDLKKALSLFANPIEMNTILAPQGK